MRLPHKRVSFAFAMLVTLVLSAGADEFICKRHSCTALISSDGKVVEVTFRRGDIISTDGGWVVNSDDGWEELE